MEPHKQPQKVFMLHCQEPPSPFSAFYYNTIPILLILSEPLKPLVHNGRIFTTNQGKANAFMKAYAVANRLNFSRTERSRIRQLKSSDHAACCQPFQSLKLNRAIRQMRSKGGPGPDDTHSLKRLAHERKRAASTAHGVTLPGLRLISWPNVVSYVI